MKRQLYIITGINRLSGAREQLSRPMGEEEAKERLDRELQARRHQRFAAHTRLKIERLEAVQLTFNFNEYDQN